jgi:hypothetical protein
LKPAEKQPNHTTGWHNPVKSNQLIIIGINKLGTLLSSQTTDTFEYFSNKYLNSDEFFVSISSLRCL